MSWINNKIAGFFSTEMKKDNSSHRSKDADTTNEVEVENGDPLSGSSDPFDALLSSKSDQTPTKPNGKKAPSPIPDESDAENDADEKNDDDKSDANGDSVDSADNGTGGENEEGYEVQDIVGHKFRGKKRYFRIRWKNYDESSDTWELVDNLSCPEIIDRYLEENPDANKEPKEKKKVSKFQIYFVRPCRWHDTKFDNNKNGFSLKVRISLPPSASSRSTPKRTAAERKSIVDEDDTDNDDSEKKKSSPKSKKSKKSKAGRPPKATKQEYEVEKIIDDEMRSGKKFYRIRWKGWAAKDDTWEPKASLSCPDIIKKYESKSSKADNEEYEVEKIVGEKIEHGTRHFLVKWKGWPESDNSWEAEKSVDCYELIEKFRDSCRSTGKATKRAAGRPTKSAQAKKARKAASEDEADDDDNENDEDENDDDEKEWEVEKIVNMRKKGAKKEFLIRWKGCKASDDTWEPEDQISSPGLIAAFLKKNKK